jgi:hypothetical protein
MQTTPNTYRRRNRVAALAAVAALTAVIGGPVAAASADDGGAVCHLRGRIQVTSLAFRSVGLGTASCVGFVGGQPVDPSNGSFELAGRLSGISAATGSGSGRLRLHLQQLISAFEKPEIPAIADFRFTRVASVLDLLAAPRSDATSVVQGGVAQLLSQTGTRSIDAVVRIADAA